MKTFASAVLLVASACASFNTLINFDFDQYFIKSERKAKPALGSYDYNWSTEAHNGDFSVNLWLEGDFVAEYMLPFDDTSDDISWTLTLTPEINLGGTQQLSLDTPYLATDFFLDVWPFALTVGETYLQWDPPLFENFCMSSGWKMTLMDFWLSMDISLWECKAGLFDWLLNGNSHECGLETYKFDNDIYELHYSANDRSGDFITNTCTAPADENGTTQDASDTSVASSTTGEVTTTKLNDAEWF